MKTNGRSYFDFAHYWSLEHQQYFRSQKMLASELKTYDKLVEDSFLAQKELESVDALSFEQYLKRYLST